MTNHGTWLENPWYGILTVIGTVAALIFIFYRWRQKGYSKWHFTFLTTFGLLIALFGARWWYLMWNPSHYVDMMSLFKISEGRAIQGAIFFGGAFIWAYTKWIAPDLEFRKVASMIVPHVLLAQAIGRWGNFYNQEIYGELLTGDNPLWYLPEFIRDGMWIEDSSGVIGYRNPLFLWESIANMVGWVILGFVLYDNKYLKDGSMIGLYMMWYNTTRAIMEPMRHEDYIMKIGDVPTTFILSIIFAVGGLWTFIWYQFELFDRYMVWFNFKQPYLTKHIVTTTKLTWSLFTMQIKYKEFATLHSVSKNRYNTNISNLDKEEIAKYRRSL